MLYCAHKEHIDKDHVQKLLVSLSGDKECKPVVFADEVMLENNHSHGPTGRIDLCVGTRCDEDDAAYCVTTTTRICWICHVSFAEAKSSVGSSEIGEVAQLVLEILSLAQMLKKSTNRPQLLLFANKSAIRPFLYYQSLDVLLTTKHEIVWKNKDVLCVFGVTLVSPISNMCRTSALIRMVTVNLGPLI